MARSTRSGLPGQVFPTPEVVARRTVATRSPDPARLGLAPRRSAAVAKSEAAKSLQRFVRQDYWNGLAAGDVVRVAGHTARGRHWRFRAHVTNTGNGATWVEVALVDGPAPTKRPVPAPATVDADSERSNTMGRVEKVRSFDPSLVTPRWRRRGRMATLLRSGAADGTGLDGITETEEPAAQPSLF